MLIHIKLGIANNYENYQGIERHFKLDAMKIITYNIAPCSAHIIMILVSVLTSLRSENSFMINLAVIHDVILTLKIGDVLKGLFSES